MKYAVDVRIEKRVVEQKLKKMTEKYQIFKDITLNRKWTGIHYYHPPRYTNRLLVIGFFGKLFHLGGKMK